MADLTSKTISDGYPNLVTVGATTNDNPTSGTLQNGKGNNITSATFDGAVTVNESGGDNDFRVEGDTEANLLFVDASTDRVGIGTNSPDHKLDVSAGTNKNLGVTQLSHDNFTNEGVGLTFTRTSSDNDVMALGVLDTDKLAMISRFGIIFAVGGLIDYQTTSEAMRITNVGDVGIGTTSPAKELDVDGEIRASGGILFGSDTAAANTLDDYEEGTWTPVYSPQTGSFTTMTMDVLSATYTKIGRQVTVRAYMRTDNVDATGASGALRISGLPFASASSNAGWSAISVGSTNAWSTAPDGGYVRDGESAISLTKSDVASLLQVSDITTGATPDQNLIILTATYFA